MEHKTELIKTYRVRIPAVKFIGRCYHEEDKKDGIFGWLWGKWFAEGLFAPIEALQEAPDFVEDGDAYCGLSRILRDGSYEYWIGMLVPETAGVPDGYECLPIPACDAIVNWVYGKEPDVYFHCCLQEMEALGYHWDADTSGERLMMERYACPRFTKPDEKGNLILDLVYFTDYRSDEA